MSAPSRQKLLVINLFRLESLKKYDYNIQLMMIYFCWCLPFLLRSLRIFTFLRPAAAFGAGNVQPTNISTVATAGTCRFIVPQERKMTPKHSGSNLTQSIAYGRSVDSPSVDAAYLAMQDLNILTCV